MLDYATYPAITSAGDALSGSCVRGMPFELNSFVTPNLVALRLHACANLVHRPSL